eukprot:jgi/Botrbrau1/4662/Bobra.33_2s0033.1
MQFVLARRSCKCRAAYSFAKENSIGFSSQFSSQFPVSFSSKSNRALHIYLSPGFLFGVHPVPSYSNSITLGMEGHCWIPRPFNQAQARLLRHGGKMHLYGWVTRPCSPGQEGWGKLSPIKIPMMSCEIQSLPEELHVPGSCVSAWLPEQSCTSG